MLYIHIGLHKTGTSTIQKFMSENAEALGRHGVIYPTIGRANNAHHNLAAEIRPDPNFYRKKKGGWSRLVGEIAANPGKAIVISSEGFHTLPAKSVEMVRAATAGIDVRIICYIRDLAFHWQSNYAERTKTGNNVLDFDEYFKTKTGTSAVKEIRRWSMMFGATAMRVRSLDPRNLVDENLLSDFLTAIDLSYQNISCDLAAKNDLIRNPSPGWKTIELIRQLHLSAGGMRASSTKKSEFKLTEAHGVSSKIKNLGLAIGADLGLDTEKAQYLTRSQAALASSRYAEMIDKLNREDAWSKIPAPESIDLGERPFLPEAALVPIAERAAFHQAFLFELLSQLATEGADKATRRGVKHASAETDGDVAAHGPEAEIGPNAIAAAHAGAEESQQDRRAKKARRALRRSSAGA